MGQDQYARTYNIFRGRTNLLKTHVSPNQLVAYKLFNTIYRIFLCQVTNQESYLLAVSILVPADYEIEMEVSEKVNRNKMKNTSRKTNIGVQEGGMIKVGL